MISLDFLDLGLQKEARNSKLISTQICRFGWSKKGGLGSPRCIPIGEAFSYGFLRFCEDGDGDGDEMEMEMEKEMEMEMEMEIEMAMG